jgi:ubiquinone/menaquinone biosynthesis C-methylase UbiE
VEWDAKAYHRLSSPQFSWGQTLLKRLRLRGDETVMDAGCGSGRLTAEILERLPEGRVIAVDRSQNMLAEAWQHLEPRCGGRVSYVCADLADLEETASPEPVDVVVSAATLHWVLDHDRLFARLFDVLRPGGRLVAQCGGSGNLERLRARAAPLFEADPLAPYFAGAPDPWVFHDDLSTAARLRASGFTDIETSLERADTPFTDAATFRDFLEKVIFAVAFLRVPEPPRSELAGGLAEALTRLAKADDPPFSLDYRRLNIAASRPARLA